MQVRQLLAEYFFGVRLWRTEIQPFKRQQCTARMAKNSQYNWYADCVGLGKFSQSICFRFEHIERVSFARFQEYRPIRGLKFPRRANVTATYWLRHARVRNGNSAAAKRFDNAIKQDQIRVPPGA